jgi:hypothetical protein
MWLVLLMRLEPGQLLMVATGMTLMSPPGRRCGARARPRGRSRPGGHGRARPGPARRRPGPGRFWDALRRTTTGPWAMTRAPRASLAPCSLAREVPDTGEGSDRTSAPSASESQVSCPKPVASTITTPPRRQAKARVENPSPKSRSHDQPCHRVLRPPAAQNCYSGCSRLTDLSLYSRSWTR